VAPFGTEASTETSVKRQKTAASHLSFSNALIVIAGELTLGVLQEIALGVVLSLLTLIYRTSHPQGAMLGQLPGTEVLSRYPTPSRGDYFSRVADLASRRRPLRDGPDADTRSCGK
jgi:MFS superfamily sulfate permease-like transporter